MKSIVLINFYFGKFPNYFPFFLETCKSNRDITWIIYTDNNKTGEWPTNVLYNQISFDKCKELFQSKFDFSICLDSPRKLCDYKVAYGYILANEIQQYDYWGYCDLDVVYGNVRSFINKYLEQDYDKIYSLGHFTLYKNKQDINELFFIRAREVFSSSQLYGFDEWGKDNINDLFLKSKYSFYSGILGADIWPSKQSFYLSEINHSNNRYHIVTKLPCIFCHDNTGLYMIDQETSTEVAYVHFQKRKLDIEGTPNKTFYLAPNIFTNNIEIAKSLGFKRYIIDLQFIKLKIRNIKIRIIKLMK